MVDGYVTGLWVGGSVEIWYKIKNCSINELWGVPKRVTLGENFPKQTSCILIPCVLYMFFHWTSSISLNDGTIREITFPWSDWARVEDHQRSWWYHEGWSVVLNSTPTAFSFAYEETGWMEMCASSALSWSNKQKNVLRFSKTIFSSCKSKLLWIIIVNPESVK